jgi:hypothetical protein
VLNCEYIFSNMFMPVFVRTLLRWEVIVRYVDIDGIDDHHCVYFLFIMKGIKTK